MFLVLVRLFLFHSRNDSSRTHTMKNKRLKSFKNRELMIKKRTKTISTNDDQNKNLKEKKS